MSSLWNEVKQSFSGTKQELDETGKAILDIENKKKTIAEASNKEQQAIMQKIDSEYREIGETSYKLYEEGNFEIAKISGMFENIKGFMQALDGKKVKLNEILSRYDEELKILRPAPPAGQEICPNCGTIYIPGEMLFCGKCGNKLPEKSSDMSEVDSTLTQHMVCPNCKLETVSGSVFCAHCGNKL